ncbi:MAG: MerR family transcriptional regulator [Candidatus Nanopelagicaceae bacterium]|nr:MerR family transcriptional regulator [Candidatus Nanopelagicaceae bacterium]
MNDEIEITVGELARRLGVAPATLRTWARRYGLGPSGHEVGAHRKYDSTDVARIAVMRRLVISGVSPKEAALIAVDADVSEAENLPTIKFEERSEIVEVILKALESLDISFVNEIIRREILANGVIATWVEIVTPTLIKVGDHWSRTGLGVGNEHLLTEMLIKILREVSAEIENPVNAKPIVLAAIGEELHSLALHALLAALAERNIQAYFFGARTPVGSLVEVVRKVAPPVVFVWAQLPENADYSIAAALPAIRPPTRLLLGGPGWEPSRCADATLVVGLSEACEIVSSTLGVDL